MNVNAPINGAVSNQIRAHTIQENMQIFCFVSGNSSAVHVNKTACEQVVAMTDSIANIIPNEMYAVSETVICSLMFFLSLSVFVIIIYLRDSGNRKTRKLKAPAMTLKAPEQRNL